MPSSLNNFRDVKKKKKKEINTTESQHNGSENITWEQTALVLFMFNTEDNDSLKWRPLVLANTVQQKQNTIRKRFFESANKKESNHKTVRIVLRTLTAG